MKFKAYLVALHIALIPLLMTHDNIQRLAGLNSTVRFPDKMINIHHYKSLNAIAGSSVFIGDSITHRMSTSFLGSPATNYGISWARTTDVLKLIPRIKNLHHADRIFLLIGINDFISGESDGIDQRLEAIAALLPPGVPVVWSGIQPVDERSNINNEIAATNLHISRICAEMQDCTYIDVPGIFEGDDSSYYSDPVHFSKQGYSAWQKALLEAAHQAP
tara:strand:+ start:253 stop:906 length:654 start_codon:yes stop_codon:yes gene_type:complete